MIMTPHGGEKKLAEMPNAKSAAERGVMKAYRVGARHGIGREGIPVAQMMNGTVSVTNDNFNVMQKALIFVGIGAIVIIAGVWAINSDFMQSSDDINSTSSQVSMTEPPVQVIPIEHATAVFQWGETVLYVDPTGGASAFAGQPPANIVLVTDVHGDHLDLDTLGAVLGEAALIVPQAVKDELPEELAARATVMANGETIEVQGFRIEAIPMYNLPDAENSNYHTKGRGNGYIVEQGGYRLYIAGDTAGIPEMRALQNIGVALVPMNLPYTMGVEEAADAVLEFKPSVVIPYHYRGPDGLADVEQFRTLVNAEDPNIDVQLLEWY